MGDILFAVILTLVVGTISAGCGVFAAWHTWRRLLKRQSQATEEMIIAGALPIYELAGDEAEETALEVWNAMQRANPRKLRG